MEYVNPNFTDSLLCMRKFCEHLLQAEKKTKNQSRMQKYSQ